MEVKAGQVLRSAPFHHTKSWTELDSCNLHQVLDFVNVSIQIVPA